MCVPTTDPGIGTDKHRRFSISKIGGLQYFARKTEERGRGGGEEVRRRSGGEEAKDKTEEEGATNRRAKR